MGKKMEGYCSTGQSAQQAAVPVEEEEEEEEEEVVVVCKMYVMKHLHRGQKCALWTK
jgi:hypothetical protein